MILKVSVISRSQHHNDFTFKLFPVKNTSRIIWQRFNRHLYPRSFWTDHIYKEYCMWYGPYITHKLLAVAKSHPGHSPFPLSTQPKEAILSSSFPAQLKLATEHLTPISPCAYWTEGMFRCYRALSSKLSLYSIFLGYIVIGSL